MASGHKPSGGVSKAKRKFSEGGNKSLKRSKPTAARKIPIMAPSNSLRSDNDNNNHHMMKITLSSISKLEVKNLKKKLISELNEVRSLIKRLEPRRGANIAGDFSPVNNKKISHGGASDDKGTLQILKNCNNLLTKLMKHKSGWVFNTPVDATRLGLYDYHTIVKKPMDLGTVKTRLSKSLYKSPLDFAEEVRLTFNNAMLYNPKAHEVYRMAEFFLNMFEEKWAPLETQYEFLNRRQQQTRDFEAPVSTNIRYVEPLSLPAPTPSPSLPLPPMVVEDRTLERAESVTNTVVEPEVVTAVPDKPEGEDVSGNMDLTFDEKRRLSEDLQDLPFDKLEEVVQIIKKRNPEIAQEDDEIELDIDSLDLRTLWELFRFVTEYKESTSKKKEERGLGSERDAGTDHNSVQEPNALVTGCELAKATELGHVAASVRREVNTGGSSSSNSSSSGSGSCSSDSDSDSSRHGSGTGK
ncbi:unnamed protein product [Cochlearia groenlandica]